MRLAIAACLAATIMQANATAFDVWASEHGHGDNQSDELQGLSSAIWGMPGEVIILNQEWDGARGIGRAVLAYASTGPRLNVSQPAWITGDADEAGRLTFFAWTPDDPPWLAAQYGQAADVASTATLLVGGGVHEANPLLGSPAALVAGSIVKLASVPLAKRYSVGVCYRSLGVLGSVGWGAAAWNLALPFVATPYGAAIALGTAVVSWPDANELFWTCAPGAKAFSIKVGST